MSITTESVGNMDHNTSCAGLKRLLGAGSILLASVASTGCQVDVAGQTLPSAYYLQDDIQYFPAGPEFKLSNEAAAMEEYRAQEALGEQ